MKILIVIDSLASGGAQKLKYHLSKGLLEKKFDVELFIYDSNYPFMKKSLWMLASKLISVKGNPKDFL